MKYARDLLKRTLRWLDLRPHGWSLVFGLGLGAGLGTLALLVVKGWIGLFLNLVLIGLAVALGAGAQPVLRPTESASDSHVIKRGSDS